MLSITFLLLNILANFKSDFNSLVNVSLIDKDVCPRKSSKKIISGLSFCCIDSINFDKLLLETVVNLNSLLLIKRYLINILDVNVFPIPGSPTNKIIPFEFIISIAL